MSSDDSDRITPQAVYRQRRRLLSGAAALAGGHALTAAAAAAAQTAAAAPALQGRPAPSFSTLERVTAETDATTYNNFVEFGPDKASPSQRAGAMRTRPWTVQVDGECERPQSFDLDALLALAPLEQRIYRFRCVEGWSMVIPWLGYPLSAVLERVRPTGAARFVQFRSLLDAARMPGARGQSATLLPYVEGLRLDEAMHPLTLLTLGMYGRVLPNVNGAPVRVTVPWKYGFKSPKSIVQIRLVGTQPQTSWSRVVPDEYGFYANVNPDVDHPRWSQASERRLGEDGFFTPKRRTQPFNGYGGQVAALYAGMDLRQNF